MDWWFGLASGASGVVVTLVSTWLVRKCWPELDRDTRQMVRRFREVVKAHGIPPHQAARLFGESIPAVEFASDVGIASVLTPERCDLLCDRLSINSDWLIHGVGKPQSTWSIERSSHCWIDELGEAKKAHELTMIICRSEPIELTDQPRQAGAIILRKKLTMCGDVSVETCLPCMSLQSWNSPQQRDLATRLIIVCNALRIPMIGVTIPDEHCRDIASGKRLAASFQSHSKTIVWHPEDYGYSSWSAASKDTDRYAESVRRMDSAGQIDRLVDWQVKLGITDEWAADAIMRRESLKRKAHIVGRAAASLLSERR